MATANIQPRIDNTLTLNGNGEVSIKAESKTPRNRLLDMMAGWAEYADKDNEDGFEDAPDINDKIHDLYQDAGALGFNNSIDAEDEVREFVIKRVLPLLTSKS